MTVLVLSALALHAVSKFSCETRSACRQQMSSLGLALGGCACPTYSVLLAAAAPCQPAEGEQAVSQPHPGVSGQLQDV